MMHVISIATLISVYTRIIAAEQVNIDVYYESLCPDSKAFITKHLHPTITKDFSSNVNITLYPFGKSSYRFTDHYIFNCHHGPEECRGNKIHACALRLIDGGNHTKDVGYNKKSFDLVNCLMDKVKVENKVADFHLQDCAKESQVEIADRIENCSKSQQGDEFLSEYGHFTDKLEPSLQSVPLIVFNKKNDPKLSGEAIANLKVVLCEQFQEQKPHTCGGSVSLPSIIIIIISILIVAIVVIAAFLLYPSCKKKYKMQH